MQALVLALALMGSTDAHLGSVVHMVRYEGQWPDTVGTEAAAIVVEGPFVCPVGNEHEGGECASLRFATRKPADGENGDTVKCASETGDPTPCGPGLHNAYVLTGWDWRSAVWHDPTGQTLRSWHLYGEPASERPAQVSLDFSSKPATLRGKERTMNALSTMAMMAVLAVPASGADLGVKHAATVQDSAKAAVATCRRGCSETGECWMVLATFEENVASDGASPTWVTHKRYVGDAYPTWVDALCGGRVLKEHGMCVGSVATASVYTPSKVEAVLADGSEVPYPAEDECFY